MLKPEATVAALMERDGPSQNVLLNVRDANILRLQFETLTEENQLLKKSKALYQLKAWKEIERLQSEVDRFSSENKALQERCNTLEHYQKTQLEALLELEKAVAREDSLINSTKEKPQTIEAVNHQVIIEAVNHQVSDDRKSNAPPEGAILSPRETSPIISVPVATSSPASLPTPTPQPSKADYHFKIPHRTNKSTSVSPCVDIGQGNKRKSIDELTEPQSKKRKTTQKERVLETLRSLPQARGTSRQIYDKMSRTEDIDMHRVRTYSSWLCKQGILIKCDKVNNTFVWTINEKALKQTRIKAKQGRVKVTKNLVILKEAPSYERSITEMPSLEHDGRAENIRPPLQPAVSEPSPKVEQLARSWEAKSSIIQSTVSLTLANGISDPIRGRPFYHSHTSASAGESITVKPQKTWHSFLEEQAQSVPSVDSGI